MASNENGTTPPGVVDAEGYAICPDCGTRINCGSVGLPNLELRHRGKKVCQANKAKQDKIANMKKNASILSFFTLPKVALVLSTVANPSLVQSQTLPSITSQDTVEPIPAKEVTQLIQTVAHKPVSEEFLCRFFDAIRKLPIDVPEASMYDELAVFAGNPAEHDDPSLDADSLWEEKLNCLLKSVLGWNMEGDMDRVIRRGKMGLDGLANFVKYFVVKRGVSEQLFEGKLSFLLDKIEEKISAAESECPFDTTTTAETQPGPICAPVSLNGSSTTNSAELSDGRVLDREVIDVDSFDLQDTAELELKMSAEMCQGYKLILPYGKSAHSSYPFALHDGLVLPWSYKVSWDGTMTLYAMSCSGLVKRGVNSCQACYRLGQNNNLDAIRTRLEEGVQENSLFMYHGFSGLQEMLQRKNGQIEFHRHRGLNQARKLLTNSKALDDQKRLLMAIASGKVSRVDHLITIGLRQKKGIRGLYAAYIEAAKGVYNPRGFTEEEDMKAILLWRLSGNRVAQINHRANGAPSVSYLRTRSIVPTLIPSHKQPTAEEVKKNLEATVGSVLDVLQSRVQSGQVLHTVLMFDEIATEKRLRWDPKTNYFLGVCREHAHRASTEFVNEEDMVELFRGIDERELHYAGEATISAVGALCKDNRIYPARPVLVSGDCKKESGEEHAALLQTTLDGVNSLKEKTKFRVVSLSSDGESRRGSALIHLTFKRPLLKESPIYYHLQFLTFLNLYVGDDDLTCDKDYKHVFKRFRNLFVRDRGITVNYRRITPDIITGQLKSEGKSADHIRSLFNLDDKQDVKIAYDMLKDIWSLPRSTDSLNRAFLENREALWILGKFLFHLVFPYLCIDLSLSEQIEHLSAAAHLGLALYSLAGREFLPNNLYIDTMMMIKNAIFCIAKAKVDDPDGEFWIILLGTDRLEELFGILRTMVGNDANLDILQLLSRLSGTTEVSNILAKYPHWDRLPRRLKLPALTRESKEIPDSADHLKPGLWRGNVKVKDISLQTSWKRGRRLVEEECEFTIPILAQLEHEGADILSPSGTLLFNLPLDPEDDDVSLEDSPSNKTTAPSQDPVDIEKRVEVEDRISEFLGHETTAEPEFNIIDSKLTVEGENISKARVLAQYSKYRKFVSSTDRLKRVQAIGRYGKERANESCVSETSEVDNDVLIVTDPIVTLVYSENHFWLCVGEVNGLRIDGQSVGVVNLNMLTEETVTVSYQMLGLRHATSSDDPELKHDWRTYSMMEHSFTVPGCLIQVVDPALSTTHQKMPFYLFQSSVLVALTASVFQNLALSDLRRVPKLGATHEYPYREISGSACFACEADQDLSEIGHQTTSECLLCASSTILDLSQGQRVLEHMGAHILYDPTIIRSSGQLCGLCLRPPSQCRYFLSKGKGANGNLRINQHTSTGCLIKMNFFYHVAAESTASSPCSNVPIHCPICPKTNPAIWKYFMKGHFEDKHKSLTLAKYSHIWWISDFEREEMKKIWVKRSKGMIKAPKKKIGPALVISEAHRARIPSSSGTGDQSTEVDDHSEPTGFANECETNGLVSTNHRSQVSSHDTYNIGGENIENCEGPSSRGLLVGNDEEMEEEEDLPVHVLTLSGVRSPRDLERPASEGRFDIQVNYDSRTDDQLENQDDTFRNSESVEHENVNGMVHTSAAPIVPASEVEGQFPSKRKRVRRAVELNSCLCGSVVEPSSDNAVKCKKAGCETEWYHIDCISEGIVPRNWTCEACKVNKKSRR